MFLEPREMRDYLCMGEMGESQRRGYLRTSRLRREWEVFQEVEIPPRRVRWWGWAGGTGGGAGG